MTTTTMQIKYAACFCIHLPSGSICLIYCSCTEAHYTVYNFILSFQILNAQLCRSGNGYHIITVQVAKSHNISAKNMHHKLKKNLLIQP
jgi:hypothetical protein